MANCPPDLKDHLTSFNPDIEDFTIYYGGAIYEVRGLAKVCEAIRDLNKTKFLIAGAGPDDKKLRKYFKSQSNVVFLGVLSQLESLEWTRKADLIPIFYDPSIRIHRVACSAKLFDAMMCGTPVLVNCEAIHVAEIVAKEECGLVVPYGDIKAIRESIKTLATNKRLKINMGINARKAFEREYNWRVMEDRLLNLYNEIS